MSLYSSPGLLASVSASSVSVAASPTSSTVPSPVSSTSLAYTNGYISNGCMADVYDYVLQGYGQSSCSLDRCKRPPADFRFSSHSLRISFDEHLPLQSVSSSFNLQTSCSQRNLGYGQEEFSEEVDLLISSSFPASTCKAKSYTFAALEYSNQCRCGSSMIISGGGGAMLDSSKCEMPCSGE